MRTCCACPQAFQYQSAEYDRLNPEDAQEILSIHMSAAEFGEAMGLKPDSMFVKSMFNVFDKVGLCACVFLTACLVESMTIYCLHRFDFRMGTGTSHSASLSTWLWFLQKVCYLLLFMTRTSCK